MRTPTLTPMIRAIIAINVIVFIVQSINHHYDDMIVNLFGLHYFNSDKFNPIQLITYLFVHADIGHLFGNMIGLFFFGPILETTWGDKRFLIFYFVTGIGAGFLYMGLKYYDLYQLQKATEMYISNADVSQINIFRHKFYSDHFPQNALNLLGNPDDVTLKESIFLVEESLKEALSTPTIGASGAVFGIMAGTALLFPNTELMLLFFPFPIKVKYLVTFYAAYEIYAGLNKMPGDNVAHFAHIGGMIFAFILIKIWGNNRQNFY